jgi:hypothetical protein
VLGSNDLVLLEAKAGAFDQMWLTNILNDRPDISTKLKEARTVTSATQIDEHDFQAIASLLSTHPNLKGFVPLSFGGHTVLVYPRFIVVALQGTIHEDSFFVYLIRIPGGNWELLRSERR